MSVGDPGNTRGAAELAGRAWTDITPSTLLIPIGATEQHGPHLALRTDTSIAAAVARCLAVTAADVVVAPSLPYGASGEHEDFPGTVSIGSEALELIVVELGRSSLRWATRVVFVNGHGGNLSALTRGVQRLRSEGLDAAWLPCAVPDSDPTDTHAGHIESSLTAHLHPEDLRMSRAEAGITAPISEILPELRARGVRAISANGVLGDPRGATAADGSRLFEALCAHALQRLGGSVDAHGCLQPTPE